MTAIEFETMPPWGPERQSCVIRPASEILSTSASSDSAATSASKPPTIARAWAPLPWYDSRNSTSWPVRCFQCSRNAGRIALP
jgi:hypothetical protein